MDGFPSMEDEKLEDDEASPRADQFDFGSTPAGVLLP
jgi:hypothetical protein